MNMYWVYIIRSITVPRAFYIGYTEDLKKRICDHNAGLSEYTRKYKPWYIVYCEGYICAQDAHDREKKLKQYGRVYSQLKRRIRKSLQSSYAQKVRG